MKLEDMKQYKEERAVYQDALKLYHYVKQLKAGKSPRFPEVSQSSLNTPGKFKNELLKYLKEETKYEKEDTETI